MKTPYYKKPHYKRLALYIGLFAVLGFSLSMNPKYFNVARHELFGGHETQLASKGEIVKLSDVVKDRNRELGPNEIRLSFASVSLILQFEKSVDKNTGEEVFKVTGYDKGDFEEQFEESKTEGKGSLCFDCLNKALVTVNAKNQNQLIANLGKVLETVEPAFLKKSSMITLSKPSESVKEKVPSVEKVFESAFEQLCGNLNCESRDAEDLVDDLIDLSKDKSGFADKIGDIPNKEKFLERFGNSLLAEIYSKHIHHKLIALAHVDKKMDELDPSDKNDINMAGVLLTKLNENLDRKLGDRVRANAARTNYEITRQRISPYLQEMKEAQREMEVAKANNNQTDLMAANSKSTAMESVISSLTRSYSDLNKRIITKLDGDLARSIGKQTSQMDALDLTLRQKKALSSLDINRFDTSLATEFPSIERALAQLEDKISSSNSEAASTTGKEIRPKVDLSLRASRMYNRSKAPAQKTEASAAPQSKQISPRGNR